MSEQKVYPTTAASEVRNTPTLLHPRYTRRTVEWGHWGITFMDPQADLAKNFGVIVGTVYFGCGTRGPVDGALGSATRQMYQALCNDWVNHGAAPEGLVRA